MQHNFKVGDRIKVVKLKNYVCKEYSSFLGQVFTVKSVLDHGVSTESPTLSFSALFFYNEEIELVKDDQITKNVTPDETKSHAWAIVNKSTGKVEWIRQTRSVARKLAQFHNETSTRLYQVKKIEYNFV